MWVLVIMLFCVAALSLGLAFACLVMCRASDAAVDDLTAANNTLRFENDQLRRDVDHWKDEHAKLWGVASDGLRKVKAEMRGCQSRHIDADAQEGE